jgi:anaerobic selenocysteine-containing dehydrogenase
MSTPIVRRTACNRDCPDACEMLVTVEDGRMTRLQGSPDHPVTRGFLCERTAGFLERHYAADRLTTPLRRDGQSFRPVSWEEALDEIAAAMLRFRAESGGASLLHYRCGGSMGLMKHVTDHFFARFGPVTEKSGDICSGAGEAAQLVDFGISDSNDLFDLLHSRTIVLWGKNPFVSNVHLLPILREARRRGAKLVLVDPIRHRAASLCDLVLQPRPGGDAALACGIARWLWQHGCIDHGAANYCDHLEDYRALVHARTLAEWAAAADVRVDELETLAAMYAEGPSAIQVGWGMQRRRHGAATVRALDALAAVSGNLGIAGGGVSFYFRRRGAFDLSFAAHDRPARTIPEPCLGEGILAQRDPPLRMVWITAANPVVTLPDSRTVAEALRTRELTVVVDSFLTDTARCAHLVLPATTFLEEDDLLGAYGHHWLADMTAVVPPAAGARSDYDILRSLAPRVGLGDEFHEPASAWKARMLGRVAPLGVTPARLAAGGMKNPLATPVLFADRRFPTSTGKVQLLRDLDESLTSPLPPAQRQATLSALSTARAQSSQWAPDQQQGPAAASVHPRLVPGARDGQEADLITPHGSLRVVLRFHEGLRSDIVLMDKGGWLAAGRCANLLIRGELTDLGEGANYYDTPVDIRLA